MANLMITDKDIHEDNLRYIDQALSELFLQTDCKVLIKQKSGRSVMIIDCPIICYDIVKAEVDDKCADVIVVNYKYEFFKNVVRPEGLNGKERELLLTGIISADLEEDKRYVTDKLKNISEYALDGVYNFRLRPLKRKWQEIAEYIPTYFVKEQLKDFMTFLLEDKKKKVFVDGVSVYDSHYRKLIRSRLLGEKQELNIVKEIMLSSCGEVELDGHIPKEDEYYLKEFYGGRITITENYFH